MRVSYVNGRYVPHSQAVVHVEDRGYQFADAVYEVFSVVGGRICHLGQHMERLDRSLGALAMQLAVSRRVLPVLLGEVVRRNRLRDGVIYLQASRGVAHRNHVFPTNALPNLVISAWPQKGPAAKLVEEGVSVVTRPDLRWKRPDIKTVGLLPNVLARQSAKEAGAYEAWLIDERGFVVEGAATNAFIVARDGAILTHPADTKVLNGVTRLNVIALARQLDLEVGERPFSLAEAMTAREAFLTGTTVTVLPVTRIDGTAIGDGRPGPVTQRLRALYQELRRS